MNDETIRLILDLVNSSKDTAELTARLEALKGKLEEVGPAADKATKSTVNLGHAGLTAGRALQDFTQGGIGGILNNIEGLSMALGGGAGLAGLLTAVGVAAFIAKPFVVELYNEFMKGGLKTEAEAMEELAKATTHTAEETEKLNKYKERQAELAKILLGLTKDQVETQKLVKEYLEGGKGKQIVGGIAKAIGASGRGAQMTPEETEIAAGYRLTIADAAKLGLRNLGAEEGLAAIQDRINAANFAKAGDLASRAPTEKGARDTLRALGRQFPGALPPGFASDLDALEPGETHKRKSHEGLDEKIKKNIEASNKALEARAKEEERGAKFRAEKIREDMKLGHQVGAAFEKQKEKKEKDRKDDFNKRVDNIMQATDIQVKFNQEMLRNHDQERRNNEILRRQVEQARGQGRQGKRLHGQIAQDHFGGADR